MSLLDSLLHWLVPAAKDKNAGAGGKDKIERRASANKSFAPSSSVPGAIAVMIADFDGPEGDNFAERIAGAIGAYQGLAVLRRRESLRLAGTGGQAEKLIAAAEQGRAWIEPHPRIFSSGARFPPKPNPSRSDFCRRWPNRTAWSAPSVSAMRLKFPRLSAAPWRKASPRRTPNA
ncbi:MAG: hypothetical protein EXR04_08020 [Rhodospirillales bacterium]|nr:hypothetical protein [Rhodospirillales bacterium]